MLLVAPDILTVDVLRCGVSAFQAVYKNASFNPNVPRVGDAVCVVSQDYYCRAVVRSVGPSGVLVEHIDYGSFDLVSPPNVHTLTPEFCKHVQIAVQVCLPSGLMRRS